MEVDCRKCKVRECIIAKHCLAKWKRKINACKITSLYKKNQPIVKEETTAMGIYIVQSGTVLIISEKENARRQIVRLAGKGEILEHKISKNHLSSPFTAEAFLDSQICYIPKDTFFQLLNEDQQLTIYLESYYTNKYIEAEKRLNNFVLMSIREKVADALLIIAAAFNGEVPFLRKELGELIGISAEQVSRELKKLMNDGIIVKIGQNKKIVIKDISKLQNIVAVYN